MAVEVTSTRLDELLVQEYNADWKIDKISSSNGRSIQTPGFYPIHCMDLKLSFEIVYNKEVKCLSSERSYSVLKLSLVKLFGFKIPSDMEMRIEVGIHYHDGKLYQQYTSESPVEVNKMNSVLCINSTTLCAYRTNEMQSRPLIETDHKKRMDSESLILKCSLAFFNHLTTPLDFCCDEREFDNLTSHVSNYKTMQETNALSDIVIRIEDETIPAHKLVLAAHSSVLMKMVTSDIAAGSKTDSITITDCDTDTFKCFLNYLYSGTLGYPSWNTLTKVYTLASKYDAPTLKRAAAAMIGSYMNVDNIFEILRYAYVYDDKDLQFDSRRFAAVHFEELKIKKEWSELVASRPIIGYEILANLSSVPIET